MSTMSKIRVIRLTAEEPRVIDRSDMSQIDEFRLRQALQQGGSVFVHGQIITTPGELDRLLAALPEAARDETAPQIDRTHNVFDDPAVQAEIDKRVQELVGFKLAALEERAPQIDISGLVELKTQELRDKAAELGISVEPGATKGQLVEAILRHLWRPEKVEWSDRLAWGITNGEESAEGDELLLGNLFDEVWVKDMGEAVLFADEASAQMVLLGWLAQNSPEDAAKFRTVKLEYSLGE